MRTDGVASGIGMKDASDILPRHYSKFYGTFVEFLQKFIDILYIENLDANTIAGYMEDESWWSDKDKTFTSPEKRQSAKIEAIIQQKGFHGIGAKAVEIVRSKTFEKKEFQLKSLDGFSLETSTERTLSTEEYDEAHYTAWLQTKGFLELKSLMDIPKHLDPILFVNTVKDLFRIRGTLACAKIFFSMMYECEASVFLPRKRLAKLDDNFSTDSLIKLRDDYFWDEYSYVVVLGDSSNYSKYGDRFLDIWNRYFHPLGFNCFLRQNLTGIQREILVNLYDDVKISEEVYTQSQQTHVETVGVNEEFGYALTRLKLQPLGTLNLGDQTFGGDYV